MKYLLLTIPLLCGSCYYEESPKLTETDRKLMLWCAACGYQAARNGESFENVERKLNKAFEEVREAK